MVIITTAETHWSGRITLYLTTDFAPWFGGSDGFWFSLDVSFLFKALETVWAFCLVLWVSTGFPARGRSVFSGADLWFCSGPGLRSSSKAVLWSGFPAEDNRNHTTVTFGIYTEQLVFSPHIDGDFQCHTMRRILISLKETGFLYGWNVQGLWRLLRTIIVLFCTLKNTEINNDK